MFDLQSHYLITFLGFLRILHDLEFSNTSANCSWVMFINYYVSNTCIYGILNCPFRVVHIIHSIIFNPSSPPSQQKPYNSLYFYNNKETSINYVMRFFDFSDTPLSLCNAKPYKSLGFYNGSWQIADPLERYVINGRPLSLRKRGFFNENFVT
jgi:hypothetical protein